MAALSDMLNRVHDEFPAAPEAVALRALSDSVKEFCRRTHAWQESVPAVHLRAGASEYELATDAGVMVVAIKEVRIASTGERVPPYATELKRILTTPLRAGPPLGYVQRTPSVLELLNAPAGTDTLSVLAALTLADGTTNVDIPDDLVNEYAEQLGAGAKLRLVKQAGQPWFAPDATPIYATVFYRAVNEAKARVISALGEADMHVQMRSW